MFEKIAHILLFSGVMAICGVWFLTFDKIAHVMLFLGAASVFGMGVLLGSMAVDLGAEGRDILSMVSAIASASALVLGVAMVASFFE